MQSLEVSWAVRYIYIYDISRLRVKIVSDFLDVTPYSLFVSYYHFGQTYCLNILGWRRRNAVSPKHWQMSTIIYRHFDTWNLYLWAVETSDASHSVMHRQVPEGRRPLVRCWAIPHIARNSMLQKFYWYRIKYNVSLGHKMPCYNVTEISQRFLFDIASHFTK